MKNLVINLVGGPGCGKSTTMAGVFFYLKKRGYNCEMATEYTKDKVWEEDYRAMDDQMYIIGKQFHRISRLVDKVDIVIMDTSLLSSIIYDKNKSDALRNLCIEAYNKFNNLVVFIERDNNAEYQEEGRREDLQQSLAIDEAYIKLLTELGVPFLKVKNDDSVPFIIEKLKEDGYITD